MQKRPQPSAEPLDDPSNQAEQEAIKAYSAIAGSLVFVILAFSISIFTKVDPLGTFSVSVKALALGLLAVLPMLGVLVALEVIKHPVVLAFRERQIVFFSQIGFRFTPLRIILMSLGAGIGEELLFRGALQAWLDQSIPTLVAIAIPSLIFGLLHNANRIYMIIAGGIGAYLGLIFALSGNILIPVIAHTIYDIIAFAYTNKLLNERISSQAAKI